MLRGKSLKVSTSYNVQQDESATPNGGTTSLVALLKQEEEEESRQRGKKSSSVLAKVKQRARKWRQTLNKKRDRHPPPDNTTPELSWQASFRDDDDGDDDDNGPHEEEDDAEIFRTPRHEFEREAEDQKETASSGQHLGTTTFTLKDVLPKEYSDDLNEDRFLPQFLDKASTEAIASETESLADHVVPPAAAADLSISGTCEQDGISSGKPGEEDRPLSRAISGSINPNGEGGAGGGGLIHKLRSTVSSLLLRKEEPPSSSSSAANSDLAEKSGDRQTR